MKITHQTEYELFVALLPAVMTQNPATEPAELMNLTSALVDAAVEHLAAKGIVKDTLPKKNMSIRPPNRYSEL